MNYQIPKLSDAGDEFAKTIVGTPALHSKRRAGLTERVMAYIAAHPDITARDVAHALGVPKSSVGRAISWLRGKNRIYRTNGTTHETAYWAAEKFNAPPVSPQSWLSALEWKPGGK